MLLPLFVLDSKSALGMSDWAGWDDGHAPQQPAAGKIVIILSSFRRRR